MELRAQLAYTPLFPHSHLTLPERKKFLLMAIGFLSYVFYIFWTGSVLLLNFLEQSTTKEKKDSNLIGQFLTPCIMHESDRGWNFNWELRSQVSLMPCKWDSRERVRVYAQRNTFVDGEDMYVYLKDIIAKQSRVI